MKPKKLLIPLILGLMFMGPPAKAQQVPYYTQFMMNDYLINPAVAGTRNHYQIRANSRIQWVGMTDAPRTNSISVYGPSKNRPMGWGGYFYHDVTGPTSRTSVNGSYAYNIALNDMMRLSGGITFGLMQYKLDGTQINIGDEVDYDPVFTGNVETAFVPDASIGLYLYSSQYYVGLSSHQLLGNKLNLHSPVDSVSNDEGINRLKQHIYLSGGMLFLLGRDWVLQPSVLLKTMFPGQFQVDVNAKVTYDSKVWGGLSFRSGDAVAVMVGYNYEGKFYFGLSYDITYSELRRYSSGTYEVMLGVRFDDIR